jgi:PAS domain-containing protein
MTSGPEFRSGALSSHELIDPATLVMLLDHAYEAVAVRRRGGEILYWNRGAERTYGWTAAEAAGQISHVLRRTRLTS